MPENQPLPLSALQHYVFCRRQCALIHIERMWIENIFTADGRVMHERVHDEGEHYVNGIKVERSADLYSEKLGLYGQADAVEFHKTGNILVPFPVEYKRGKPKKDNCDKVQLCAQALCLEEMLGVNIVGGALFYGKIKRRVDVIFDAGLRSETIKLSESLHGQHLRRYILLLVAPRKRCVN